MSQTRMIAGKEIKVNDEGYLTDYNQWDKQVAETLANEARIELTPKHWQVLEWLQEQQRKEVALNIRKVGASGVVDIKEFYSLFPVGPLKTATKIAGIPKPASCI